jgi:integrase
MATIFQRGKVWRAMVCRRGKRTSATFDTRAEAEQWAIGAEAAILAGAKVDILHPAHGGIRMSDLMDRYSAEVSIYKKGRRFEQIRLKSFPERFDLFRRPVAEIDPAAMAEWRDQRLKRVQASTVNRELNLISSLINTAIKEWRIPGLTVNPISQIRRPKDPRPRRRRVSDQERRLICGALGWDEVSQPSGAKQWSAFAFCLALETAMRKGEILSLSWGNLHMDRRYAHLGDTKNGDERDVPLSSRALGLLQLLAPGKGRERVVPVLSGTLDQMFRRAVQEAGVADLHFHDSRREAATVMSKRLSNVLELAAVTGHRSLNTLKIYYRPEASDLADKLG